MINEFIEFIADRFNNVNDIIADIHHGSACSYISIDFSGNKIIEHQKVYSTNLERICSQPRSHVCSIYCSNGLTTCYIYPFDSNDEVIIQANYANFDIDEFVGQILSEVFYHD